MISKKIFLPLLILLALATKETLAQHKKIAKNANQDTLYAYRLFTDICRSWQQPPLHIKVAINNNSNFITASEDSIFYAGEFYIKDSGAYARFGEIEQVLSNSTALLISHNLHRMLLYTHAGQMIKNMRGMMSSSMQDTSLLALSKKFTAVMNVEDEHNSSIILSSRQIIAKTGFPVESVYVNYDANTHLPKKIASIKRSLLPLDSSQYNAMLKVKPELKDMVITLENRIYLVKENTSLFNYESIDRKDDFLLPVGLEDRIARKTDGSYKPVKDYEDYSLIKN